MPPAALLDLYQSHGSRVVGTLGMTRNGGFPMTRKDTFEATIFAAVLFLTLSAMAFAVRVLTS